MKNISILFTREHKTAHINGFQQIESLDPHWIFSLMEENDGKLQWQVESILFHFDWHLRQVRTVMSLQHIPVIGEPKLKEHTRRVIRSVILTLKF